MRRIFRSRFIPFGSYIAINLFGFIIIRKGRCLYGRDINHELIHSRQQMELLWVFFYVWYFVEWVVRLIQYRNTSKAYYNISFEREAYAKQSEIGYLRRRKAYSWWRFLNIR